MSEKRKTLIALGSNLGNRQQHIKDALALLQEKGVITSQSSLYETPPMYVTDQPEFINMAVLFETSLAPLTLLDMLKDIEEHLKRVQTIRNGPRTIDLDVIFYEDEIVENGRLSIPHPRYHERPFVLLPANEIAPGWLCPKSNKTIKQWISRLTPTDLQSCVILKKN